MLTIIPIPAFADNYIWLLRQAGMGVVVDPGDAGPVIAHFDRDGLQLAAILATHHHGDHVGGIPALLARWPAPVFGPAQETIPGRTRALREGEAITVPGIELELSVLDIPGHTAGHIAYVGRSHAPPLVFCGDTLFAAGCGRLFEGTPGQMVASLGKLSALPDETQVYCGHEYTLANLRFAAAVEPANVSIGERHRREKAKRERGLPTLPSTIGEERTTNPFLRTGEPTVRFAAEKHAGRPLDGPVAVFAEIRSWKNAF
ncbi:MAG TPA: hydroxyacylglutathione hydrolase [Casimicrobiaceae bacterium]|nr:hydroxyacylglutathione hydrolase [Casimicrobiaceae bacterium]